MPVKRIPKPRHPLPDAGQESEKMVVEPTKEPVAPITFQVDVAPSPETPAAERPTEASAAVPVAAKKAAARRKTAAKPATRKPAAKSAKAAADAMTELAKSGLSPAARKVKPKPEA